MHQKQRFTILTNNVHNPASVSEKEISGVANAMAFVLGKNGDQHLDARLGLRLAPLSGLCLSWSAGPS